MDQQIQHFLIFIQRLKAKDLPVDVVHILHLTVKHLSTVCDTIFQLPSRKRDLLSHILIQKEILSDTASIRQTEIPFIKRFSSSGTNPHSYRKVNIAVFSFKLKVKIACPLFPTVIFFQQIAAHLTVSGAEGIQTLRTHVSIQEKRNHALHGDRFAGAV